MKTIMNKVIGFFADEKGAETAEWAVIVGLIVAIGLAVYGAGGPIETAVGTAGTSIANAIP
ncbi:Flp family type IVb pilin [Methyloglobulus sp.]|uniref:Flp family type IVb pilin n=1 Tax=Methyloglobulus sp. TaxID=2518622 RepID=UPI00398924F2